MRIHLDYKIGIVYTFIIKRVLWYGIQIPVLLAYISPLVPSFKGGNSGFSKIKGEQEGFLIYTIFFKKVRE
jgi:hypothetical protein